MAKSRIFLIFFLYLFPILVYLKKKKNDTRIKIKLLTIKNEIKEKKKLLVRIRKGQIASNLPEFPGCEGTNPTPRGV